LPILVQQFPYLGLVLRIPSLQESFAQMHAECRFVGLPSHQVLENLQRVLNQMLLEVNIATVSAYESLFGLA
jgi:hypothetical protein